MLQAMIIGWFMSSAAVALGVAVACDKIFGTFSRGPGRADRVDAARRNRRGRRRKGVLDVIFVLATIGFFALNVAFAVGCDRLMGTGRGGR